MTTFFVRLKRWQLELLMVAIFIVPIVILFTWHFFVKPIPYPAIPGPLNKTIGLTIALVVIFSFAWQWTTSRYLFGLLRTSDNHDYEQYNGFIVFMLLIGLVWALMFWTNYISFFAFYIIHHTWVLGAVFIVIITTIYFLRHALAFRFKACEALLKEVPYQSVKARFFSHILIEHWSFPQNGIREVYLKYGERKIA